MLHGHLQERTLKGRLAAEPLVDGHPQSILVTGGLGLAPKLFGSQVRRRACQRWLHQFRAPRGERLRRVHDQAKITEQDLVMGAQ